mmetsp:Transcript_12531/g.33330  ORF Transcript_12531/g.33330 Transcript_12531/m.33330 type:complete len:137 (+) Transcript_12531:3-413(+)|eukprot:4922284-Prymnesium_polylepis.3
MLDRQPTLCVADALSYCTPQPFRSAGQPRHRRFGGTRRTPHTLKLVPTTSWPHDPRRRCSAVMLLMLHREDASMVVWSMGCARVRKWGSHNDDMSHLSDQLVSCRLATLQGLLRKVRGSGWGASTVDVIPWLFSAH